MNIKVPGGKVEVEMYNYKSFTEAANLDLPFCNSFLKCNGLYGCINFFGDSKNVQSLKSELSEKSELLKPTDIFLMGMRAGDALYFARELYMNNFSDIEMSDIGKEIEEMLMILDTITKSNHPLLDRYLDYVFQTQPGNVMYLSQVDKKDIEKIRLISSNDYKIVQYAIALFFDKQEYREIISNSLKLDISDLDSREYFALVNFVFGDYQKAIKLVKKGVEISGKNFFSLLFLFLGENTKENIVEIENIILLLEKLPQEDATEFAFKFSEIIKNALSIDEIFPEKSEKIIETAKVKFITKTKEQLLTLLKNQYPKSDSADEIEKIQNFGMETKLLLSAFYSLRKHNELSSFEELGDIELSINLPDEISEEDKKEMVRIYAENWKDFADVKTRDLLVKEFAETFSQNSHDSKIYLLKVNGKISAFAKSSKEDSETTYLSSLNVTPETKAFGLGEALADSIFEEESKHSVVKMICDPKASITMKYLEKGFVAVELTNHAVPGMKLFLNKKNNELLTLKQKTREKLILDYQEGNSNIVRTNSLDDIASRLNKKNILTRCFPDPDNTSYWYAVFERLQ